MEVFGHEHPLDLIDLQPKYPHYEEEYDEDEDEVSITNQDFQCPCDRCGREINFFHRYYYKCDPCAYSLHKFCAELPTTLEHESHREHTLTLVTSKTGWTCDICQSHHKPEELSYNCSLCDFDVDENCAKKGVQNHIIHHPCHQHPLVPTPKEMLYKCDVCGKKHEGIFYHCIICYNLFIHSDCVFLSKKLLIQDYTYAFFSHPHPLTLAYSFPKVDQKVKFYPSCRVCDKAFSNENLWIYKCEKCRYYAHLDCATSRREPFMSIFSFSGLGKTLKNFEDDDHPDLLHLPFPDETYNILKHLFFKGIGSRTSETNEGNLTHISHQHPLILVDTLCNDITRPNSSRIKALSCHNPMKKAQLLCNGCLRPITAMPFYKCGNEDEHCNFVLHDWCTRLPTELKDHPGHPQHALVLLTSVPRKFFDVFKCEVCELPCNGFAYYCVECEYYIDVCCGFIPEKITHEAHPNHLLSRVQERLHKVFCRMCLSRIVQFSFSCVICDVHLHVECALLLPQTIRHKYDKHPMNLSYFPIENHKSEYFCEICEEEFDPEFSFYHCCQCVQSMHSHCAPLILQCETTAQSYIRGGIYKYVNIKFGSILNTKVHPHPLLFSQGIASDGDCSKCEFGLQYDLIFKCLQCKFAIDYECCKSLNT